MEETVKCHGEGRKGGRGGEAALLGDLEGAAREAAKKGESEQAT